MISIFFTVTWLNSSITNSELGFDNFNVFRLDRNVNNSNNSEGGGVLIAVKKHIACKTISLSKNNIETIFLSLKLDQKKIIISCTYIPPNSSLTIYQDFANILQDIVCKNNKSHFFICGDLNLPKIEWDNLMNSSPVSNLYAKADIIKSALLFHSYQQHNWIRNPQNNILDLIISDIDDVIVTECLEPLVKIDSFHSPLSIRINTKELPNDRHKYNLGKTVHREVAYSYKKANYSAISSDLNNVNWDE